MFDAVFFTTASGRSPVEDFINQQDEKAANKIYRTIGLLKKFGFRLPGKHIKSLKNTNGLWELRIKTRARTYRIFVAQVERKLVLLLHAISKKTQKTPARDLKTAQERLREYKAS